MYLRFKLENLVFLLNEINSIVISSPGKSEVKYNTIFKFEQFLQFLYKVDFIFLFEIFFPLIDKLILSNNRILKKMACYDT